MRDRTRRFKVGFSTEQRTVRVFAANDKTKAWAERNQSIMSVVLHMLSMQVERRTLASDPTLPMALLAEVETPKTLAIRFTELMTKGFPDETFDIEADVQ